MVIQHGDVDTPSHDIFILILQLFRNQEQFYDIPTSTLTPIQIREKLAQLAAEHIPSNKVNEVSFCPSTILDHMLSYGNHSLKNF